MELGTSVLVVVTELGEFKVELTLLEALSRSEEESASKQRGSNIGADSFRSLSLLILEDSLGHSTSV